MESCDSHEEIKQERMCGVEETIFVAVGKSIEKSKTTLFWAVKNFAGKKICVVHVYKPPNVVALMKTFKELERERVQEILNQYVLLLNQAGVRADKLWIERENVEEGIVELVVQHNIRWLVMGAAADKYYSKNLVELKSRKAIFLCQQAPVSCHIWFICKGCLIYTRNRVREGGGSEVATLPTFPLVGADTGTKQLEHLKVEGPRSPEEDADRVEDTPCSSARSSWSTNSEFGTSKSTLLLMDEEVMSQEQATCLVCIRSEKDKSDAQKSKQKVYEEVVKRWKEEDDAQEAVKALHSLCVKEMSQRKGMEKLLESVKQEIERMKNQHDVLLKELAVVQHQNLALESQVSESHCIVKELEDKIISAVELLISFRQKRDQLRIECRNAKTRVAEFKNLVPKEATSFCGLGLLEFSLLELNEATNDLDSSRKIGEGKSGAVYRGLLRHTLVAIKMLPSYGSHSHLQFQNEVEVLSRVRHPNLVTLIGTCPESRSLVYEYLRNGSLEDCLGCKNKTPPLTWQTRIRIASEICSALAYLHSSTPCIIHGNLKPSKILLDGSFAGKLGDLGISLLIPRDGEKFDITASSMYMDPDFWETGKLTPESDVYSFGIILLRLLTARSVSGIVKDVKCALDKGNFSTVLDGSAGDWPLEQAKQLAYMALRCCDKHQLSRPDLLTIWSVLESIRASCDFSVSYCGLKEARRVPSHFVCPIFQEVMKDPCIAADGYTYEAEAIQEWLKFGHDTSPMTNLKLEHCDLIPNYALHQAIQEWRQQW